MKSGYITRLLYALLVIWLASCDSAIYDDEGDCTARYRVPLTFTRNILNADAFASQVTGQVRLYAFDSSGRLAFSRTEDASKLRDNEGHYAMEVDLDPGTYRILVWATGTSPVADPVAFRIGDGTAAASIEALGATLPLLEDAGTAYQDHDITPQFYGMAENVVCRADDYGEIDLPTVDLMQDTKVIKVVLINMDGTEIAGDDFAVSVTSANSTMDYLNNPTGDLTVAYRPWATTLFEGDSEEARSVPAAGNRSSVFGGMMTEHTTGRIMTDRRTRLKVVRNDDSKAIIDINLTQFLTMVKGNYQGHFSDQEYLDRMDEFTLIFYIYGRTWYTAMGVFINGWKIVPPQEEGV